MQKFKIVKKEFNKLFPIFSVCSGFLSRVIMLFGLIYILFQKKIFNNSWFPFLFSVHVWCNNQRVKIFLSNKSDFFLLREIIVDKVYDTDCLDPHAVRTIVDVGSNIGVSVMYFFTKYPNAHIFAFEPDPRAFGMLKKNVKAFPQIDCHPIAITNIDGTTDFFLKDDRSISSSIMMRNASHKVRSQSLKISTIVKKYNIDKIDILKLDVEGAELSILEDLGKSGMIDCVSCIIAEIHPKLIHQDSIDLESRIKDILFGFTCTVVQKTRGELLLLRAHRI